jgi:hypothetical protein
MGNEPLKPVEISGSVKDIVTFNSNELRIRNTFSDGIGYEGSIKWDRGECSYAVRQSAVRKIKFRKI